ncbi:MAG: lytic transglycosylase domain-containing protein [Acidobacteriaceae bacterium]
MRALYGYADPIDAHGDDAEARAFRAQLNRGKGTGTIDAISKHIDDAANRIGVSPLLAHAVAWRESGENQHPYTNDPNHKAIGVMQLMPNTARGLAVDPNDAAQNIEGGVTLLKRLLKKYLGNKEEALAAYNWGEGHLDRAMKKYGGFDVSYLPPETRNYIRDVEAHMTQHVNVNVGGIHIKNPNASPEEIASAVKDGVRAGVNGQAQLNLVNASTAFGW